MDPQPSTLAPSPRSTKSPSVTHGGFDSAQRAFCEEEETSDEDKEKAKEVIRDTLAKLESEGKEGKKGSKTRKTIEKLKALLGEETRSTRRADCRFGKLSHRP
eukprot:g32295.t1